MPIAIGCVVVRRVNKQLSTLTKKEPVMQNCENMKEVYQITEREGKKAIWTRIGSAFVNKDNSLNVLLNCVPIDGKIHIREKTYKGKEKDNV